MLLVLSCNKPIINVRGIIVVEHTGNTYEGITPLIISTNSIKIPLYHIDTMELYRINGKSTFTEIEKERYIDLNYKRVITDTKTLGAIANFLIIHKDYFINNTNQIDNSTVESYQISLNDKKFQLYSKKKLLFFKDLMRYLTENDCDKKVIIEFRRF